MISVPDALTAWLVTNLDLKSAVYEQPLDEGSLPGAILHYASSGTGDSLDGQNITETYQVAIVAPSVGAQPQQVAHEIARIERKLQVASRTAARFNDSWLHLTAQFMSANREAGISLWQLSLIVEVG